jgi:hypothetical protein
LRQSQVDGRNTSPPNLHMQTRRQHPFRMRSKFISYTDLAATTFGVPPDRFINLSYFETVINEFISI